MTDYPGSIKIYDGEKWVDVADRSHSDCNLWPCRDCNDLDRIESLQMEDEMKKIKIPEEMKPGPIRDEPQFPWGILIFGVITLLTYLGFMSWQADLGVSGFAIGVALMSIAWSASRFWSDSSLRAERRDHRETVAHYRSRLSDYEDRERQGMVVASRAGSVQEAAKIVVQEAKVRDEDIDSDSDEFMFEVPSHAMIRLSNSIGEQDARPC